MRKSYSEKIDKFGSALGELLAVAGFEWMSPETREERLRQQQKGNMIHITIHQAKEPKKKTLLEEIWEN